MSNDPDRIELRLKWRKTWPDHETDFVAAAPGYDGTVARIYKVGQGPQDGLWYWTMNAFGRGIQAHGDQSGHEATGA